MGLEERAADISRRTPDLVADLALYRTEDGGRKGPAPPGWECPTTVSKDLPAWDAWPQLGDECLHPGERRRVGFVFLSPEGAEMMRKGGKFYPLGRRVHWRSKRCFNLEAKAPAAAPHTALLSPHNALLKLEAPASR